MKNKSSEITLKRHLKESITYIKKCTTHRPKIAIILGSGLGQFAENFTSNVTINIRDIPHYPRSTVEGHRGNLIFGKLNRTSILAFQGRIHFYETGELETILYPIRIAAALGIKTLFVTNAAGGINHKFKVGNLMIITDQINLTFENPLKSHPVIKQHLYDKKLQFIAEQIAIRVGIPYQKGIYCGIKGPSYETAAEVEMIRRFGADSVGMSTVNEVSLAKHFGMRIIGISCITNLSTGMLDQKLSHQDVTNIAHTVKDSFRKLLHGIISKIGLH